MLCRVQAGIFISQLKLAAPAANAAHTITVMVKSNARYENQIQGRYQ